MLKTYTNIFLKTNNVEKSSYLWNMISGLLVATQSAILLVVITRTNGLYDAGVFSIAYAIASLMLYVGDFGVRKYQVSDINERHSFQDYLEARICTCVIMITASLIYIGYKTIIGNYSPYKAILIALVCLIKVIDSFADVFYGRFQQKRRLDVATKTTAFRVIIGILACMTFLIVTQNLMLSVIAWLISSLVAMCFSTLSAAPYFCKISKDLHCGQIRNILLDCGPLFLGGFLLLYIGNAPKYAIDAYMTAEIQACFNFIFMPVFVVGMLANFIFNPILIKLTECWNQQNFKSFKKMVAQQVGIIGIITVGILFCAYFLGVPVLSRLYDTDLSEYKLELYILLIGGGMLALVNFFAVVVTIIRHQNLLTGGYLIVALLSRVLSKVFVVKFAILGAAILYTVLMALLAACFLLIMIISVQKDMKSIKN